MPLPPAFQARLVAARSLSPTVRGLTFERADGEALAFEAGQWVNLVLPLPGGDLRRAYSIASPPDGTSRFELAVTHVKTGPGSTYLHAAEPGLELRAEGPQGFFTRPLHAAGPALFVGTGTGVAPLRSMLVDAVRRRSQVPMCLLFGVREEAEILYGEEFFGLAREHPNVRVEISLSRAGEQWAGRRGYVQLHVREIYDSLAASASSPPHAFVCGLEKMVGSVREILRKEMALPRQQVHSERYD